MADTQGIRAGRAFVGLGVSDKLTAGLKRTQQPLKTFASHRYFTYKTPRKHVDKPVGTQGIIWHVALDWIFAMERFSERGPWLISTFRSWSRSSAGGSA